MSLAKLATGLVLVSGIAHLGALYLETFDAVGLVERMTGMKLAVLNVAEGFEGYGDKVERLVWNQGVYNAFLGIGLLLSFRQAPKAAWQTRVYLCLCIMVAGVFGGITVNALLYAQAVLGGLTAAVVYKAGPASDPQGA